jgi:molecular chaperone GrpE (heat shock protein)
VLLHVSSAQDHPGNGAAPHGDVAVPGHDLTVALQGLTAAIEREHERAGHREAIIDRLHEDNQLLRRGELQVLFEPVRGALYRLHDMVRREAARADDTFLAAIADEIAEALGRTGAERYTVESGESFDPARHRPVAAEPVTDPELDGTVVEVLADGFERADGEQVLRRAEVRVGRLKASG